jgi:hypothetical protein
MLNVLFPVDFHHYIMARTDNMYKINPDTFRTGETKNERLLSPSDFCKCYSHIDTDSVSLAR